MKKTGIALGVFLPWVFGMNAVSTQEAVQKPIRVEVSVTAKLVQVSVTDRKGNPITDLTAADFEVTDAGKPVKIDHFEKHIYGDPGVEPSLPQTEEPPLLSRKFFLIFDFAFMDPGGIPKAKEAALRFLDAVVLPTDEIGLVSYSPSRDLSLHEYLTKDHAKVRRTIENYGLRNVSGRAENLLDSYLDQRRLDVVDGMDVGRNASTAETDPWFARFTKSRLQTQIPEGKRASYTTQVVHFAQAMKNLALTLRPIPGAKNVLFFSQGINRQLLFGKHANMMTIQDNWDPETVMSYLNNLDSNLSDSAIRNAYTEMLDAFKASNCPIYAFNETRTRAEISIEDADGTGAAFREFSGAESLKQFASVTGGKYYHNTMDVRAAVADLKNVTGAYYVLGYTLTDVPDGSYHKIKVKVARPGTKVVAQPGYYNPKPYAEYSEFEKILHLLDVALVETPKYGVPIPIELQAVPLQAGEMSFFAAYARMPVELFEGLLGKNTEALIFLFDGQGNAQSIKRFRMTDLSAGREGHLLDFTLLVKPGAYEGRLILRNMQTGKTARGSASFEVPKPAAGGAWGDPLLFLEEGKNFASVSQTPEISLSKMYGYNPDARIPRPSVFPLGTAALSAAIRCGGLGDGKDVEFAGAVSLKSGAQTRIDVPVSVVERGSLGQTLLFRIEFPIGNLAAGTYILNLVGSSKSTGMKVLVSSEFILK